MEKPNKHGEFKHIVEGDEVEYESGELVNHVEEAEDDPVGQPLLVISQPIGLQGVEAHENGVRDTQEGRQDGLANAEHHEEHEAREAVL